MKREDFHPMDWAAHLRQSLVFDPMPTMLTLMLVTSHYYACNTHLCLDSSASHQSSSSSSSSWGFGGTNETSVIGFVFASLSATSRALQDLNVTSVRMFAEHHGKRCSSMIQTPWTGLWTLSSSSTGGSDESNSSSSLQDTGETGSSSSSSRPDMNKNNRAEDKKSEPGAEAISFTDGVLRVSMTDPFTVAYNAWTYIANGNDDYYYANDDAELLRSIDDQDSVIPAKKQAKPNSGEPKCKDESGKQILSPSFNASAIWTDVCILHGIGMAGVGFALLPSVFAPASLLACGSLCSSAWPLIHASALMFCLSLLGCCAIHHVLGMHSLALCTSIHMVPRCVVELDSFYLIICLTFKFHRIMAAFMDVCVGCPMPPIYMPGTAATGIAFGMGLLLLCVGQMAHHSNTWDTASFYMAHAWACGVAVFVLRHTVLRVAGGLVCWGHGEVLRSSVLTNSDGDNKQRVVVARRMSMQFDDGYHHGEGKTKEQ